VLFEPTDEKFLISASQDWLNRFHRFWNEGSNEESAKATYRSPSLKAIENFDCAYLNIGFDSLPKIIEDRSQSVQAARSL
jgi:hypothetical protein